jgi:uncharacterized membrane protein
MTLLVLPLVEVADEVDTNDVGGFLADHWDLFLSFVISSVVINVFWAAHSVAFRRIEDRDTEPRILPLFNLCWLVLIAFLPFPTAVVGRDLNTKSAPLYIGTRSIAVTIPEVSAERTVGMLSLLGLALMRIIETRALAKEATRGTGPTADASSLE